MAGDPAQDAQSNPIEIAIRKALRPIVRLWVEHSLRFPFAAELLKSLYVQVAAEDLPVEGRVQTDSRINFLTGVHRKDVRRLRGEGGSKFESPAQASLSTRLIARWTTQSAYLDSQGNPRPLPRVSSGTGGPSFESLVRDLNTDIRPRVVLDEWKRLGIAEIDKDDLVQLKTGAFIPAQGSQELAYYFGRNLHDHIAAAVHNVLGNKPPLLERSVNYNNLPPDAVAELNALARERGMELLQELNARALQLQSQAAQTADATNRVNFGIYFYTEDEARAGAAAATSAEEQSAGRAARPKPANAKSRTRKARDRVSSAISKKRTLR